MQEVDQIVDEVGQVETVGCHRDEAAILPFGHIDVVVGEHRLDRAAQQGGEMAGERRDDQQLGILALGVALEVEQVAVGCA